MFKLLLVLAVLNASTSFAEDKPTEPAIQTAKPVVVPCYRPEKIAWTAKPNEPVRGSVECVGGYVPTSVSWTAQGGRVIEDLMCCPAVTTEPEPRESKDDKAKDAKKKEK